MKKTHFTRTIMGIVLAGVLFAGLETESMAAGVTEKYIYLDDEGFLPANKEIDVYEDFLHGLMVGTRYAYIETKDSSKPIVAVLEEEWDGSDDTVVGAVTCSLYYPVNGEMSLLRKVFSSTKEPIRVDKQEIYCINRFKVERLGLNEKENRTEILESARNNEAAYDKLYQKAQKAKILSFDTECEYFQTQEIVGKKVDKLEKKYLEQIQDKNAPSYSNAKSWEKLLETIWKNGLEDDSVVKIGEAGGYTIYGTGRVQGMLVKDPKGNFIRIDACYTSLHNVQPQYYVIKNAKGQDCLAIILYVLHGSGYNEDSVIVVDGDYAYHPTASWYLREMSKCYETSRQGNKLYLELDGKKVGNAYDMKEQNTKLYCTIGELTQIEIKGSKIHILSEMIIRQDINSYIGDFPGNVLDYTLNYVGDGKFEAESCKYRAGQVYIS